MPFTRAGNVTIRRLDGSVDVQPPYRPHEMHGIVSREAPRSGEHRQIELRYTGPCCVCGRTLRVGERAWWWPSLSLVSCVRHEPRTPKATST